MIYAITVVNFRGESLKIELTSPERSGVIVQDITGLGAGEATINTSESANIDGSYFNSARLMPRNIVFTLLPMDEPSVETNRHKIYHFFPSKKEVTMKFETESGTRVITGYTESNDPTIFSEQVTQQVSVMCPDPHFYDEETITQSLSGITSMFEFPFSNESLRNDLIVLSEQNISRRVYFRYNGDDDTGVTIHIEFYGDVQNVRLINLITGEQMKIDTTKLPSGLGNKFIAADIIDIDTRIGQRSATLYRGANTYNIINSLGRHTAWFTLLAGENAFYFDATLNQQLMDLSLRYKNVYMGA